MIKPCMMSGADTAGNMSTSAVSDMTAGSSEGGESLSETSESGPWA